ncbi:hypothetical protein ES703_43890 [subsurface metagenome]
MGRTFRASCSYPSRNYPKSRFCPLARLRQSGSLSPHQSPTAPSSTGRCHRTSGSFHSLLRALCPSRTSALSPLRHSGRRYLHPLMASQPNRPELRGRIGGLPIPCSQRCNSPEFPEARHCNCLLPVCRAQLIVDFSRPPCVSISAHHCAETPYPSRPPACRYIAASAFYHWRTYRLP